MFLDPSSVFLGPSGPKPVPNSSGRDAQPRLYQFFWLLSPNRAVAHTCTRVTLEMRSGGCGGQSLGQGVNVMTVQIGKQHVATLHRERHLPEFRLTRKRGGSRCQDAEGPVPALGGHCSKGRGPLPQGDVGP